MKTTAKSPEKKNKYRNRKVQYDGHIFDSKKEYERYLVLKALENRGDISELECQKKYVLIPAQRAPNTVNAKGKPVKGKIIEYECAYYADFVYRDVAGTVVVEDVKSKATQTTVYKVKRKLMLYLYGIRIKEV